MENTYYSRFRYLTDGSPATFTIPFPYIHKDHVKVYLDRLLAYYKVNESNGTVTIIPSDLEAGREVLIVRDSSLDSRLVDYTGNAKLQEKDLDTDSLQAFYLIQEQTDALRAALRGDNLYLHGDDAALFSEGDTASQSIIDSILEGELSSTLQSTQDMLERQAETQLERAVSDAEQIEDNVSYKYRIQTLESTLGDSSVTLTELAEVVNGIEAQYTVTIDNNGYISGFGLASDIIDGQPTSEFIIRADKFAVVDPADTEGGTSTVPFLVENGNVYFNGAKVQPDSLTRDKISAAAIGVNQLDANEVSANIGSFGTLTGGTMRTAETGYRVELSKNGDYPIWYGDSTKTASNAKFYVDKLGNAVFKGALEAASGTFSGELQAATGSFAGDISAATGTFDGVMTGDLQAATGTFSGSLQGADGTFSGSLTASAINAVDTINVKGQAITIPVGSSSYAQSSTTSNSWQTKVSASLYSSGQPISVAFSATAQGGLQGQGDAYNCVVGLFEDGKQIYGDTAFGQDTKSMSYTILRNPGAGTHTYAIKYYSTSSSGYAAYIEKASLTLLETKR